MPTMMPRRVALCRRWSSSQISVSPSTRHSYFIRIYQHSRHHSCCLIMACATQFGSKNGSSHVVAFAFRSAVQCQPPRGCVPFLARVTDAQEGASASVRTFQTEPRAAQPACGARAWVTSPCRRASLRRAYRATPLRLPVACGCTKSSLMASGSSPARTTSG
jgi:hypothetical protein